jgi:carboxyl-terminal processing protease
MKKFLLLFLKPVKRFERLVWLGLLVVILLPCVFFLFAPRVSAAGGPEKYFNLFRKVLETAHYQYVDADKVPYDKLIYGAVKGMLEAIGDPHTIFLDKQRSESLKTEMKGSFGGLGINVGIRDGRLVVISPMEETPAWNAGLKSGDLIDKIDGKSTEGLQLDEAVAKLRGEIGTSVNLTIVREKTDAPLEVKITRAAIEIKSVVFDMIDTTKIGYLRLRSFSETSPRDINDAMTNLKARGMRSLVFDVRGNPGGLLSSAAEIVDLFVDEGLIVYTRDRSGHVGLSYSATSGTVIPKNWPIVILINNYSASASEIFAGAMQDHKRGLLVGQKTYGKFSVQNVIPLDTEDGTSFKMTTARYYLPSGRSLHAEGIAPDVAVNPDSFSVYQQKAYNKAQNKTIIAEYLKQNPDESKDKDNLGKLADRFSEEGIDLEQATILFLLDQARHKNDPPKKFDIKFDPQLREAVALLKGNELFTSPGTNQFFITNQ